jgi:putative spermidine/putrescine transport system substrate-binding protein
MTASHSRRLLLKSAAALGVAQLTGHAGLALAQGKQTISGTTFPGAWESAHRSILLPAFTKATGASTNLVASLAVDTVSKMVASKANPPFDVVILDEGPYLAALQYDIFEKVSVDKIRRRSSSTRTGWAYSSPARSSASPTTPRRSRRRGPGTIC